MSNVNFQVLYYKNIPSTQHIFRNLNVMVFLLFHPPNGSGWETAVRCILCTPYNLHVLIRYRYILNDLYYIIM